MNKTGKMGEVLAEIFAEKRQEAAQKDLSANNHKERNKAKRRRKLR